MSWAPSDQASRSLAECKIIPWKIRSKTRVLLQSTNEPLRGSYLDELWAPHFLILETQRQVWTNSRTCLKRRNKLSWQIGDSRWNSTETDLLMKSKRRRNSDQCKSTSGMEGTNLHPRLKPSKHPRRGKVLTLRCRWWRCLTTQFHTPFLGNLKTLRTITMCHS